MIIKSHIRGGYRAAADYLKEYGENEEIRLVGINDPGAKDLDEAFHNMWVVAQATKATKPLHHISINPYRDERLTDEQVLKIVKRCEEKYGYKPDDHQRVIVEHIKGGRQHFHVMWNRASLSTGKAVWPGHHWNKSKQAAREMEKELGLKRPTPRRFKARLPISMSSISRSPRFYAGMLEDAPVTEPKKTKTGKGEKGGDGAGGGTTSAMSALKATKSGGGKKSIRRIKTGKDNIGLGNGPERRRQKMWVPVERRQKL